MDSHMGQQLISVHFFFGAKGALRDSMLNGFIVISRKTLLAGPTVQGSFKVRACFSLRLEHRATNGAPVGDGGEGSECADAMPRVLGESLVSDEGF